MIYVDENEVRFAIFFDYHQLSSILLDQISSNQSIYDKSGTFDNIKACIVR